MERGDEAEISAPDGAILGASTIFDQQKPETNQTHEETIKDRNNVHEHDEDDPSFETNLLASGTKKIKKRGNRSKRRSKKS